MKNSERMEIWKEIEGSNGECEVSNLGRVKYKNNLINSSKHSKTGYMQAHFKNNKNEWQTTGLYRLVAFAFCENPKPEQYKEVNHIDGDKTNNKATNLEWVDRKLNMIHASATGLINKDSEKRKESCRLNQLIATEKNSRKCVEYDENGKLIKVYNSYNDENKDTMRMYRLSYKNHYYRDYNILIERYAKITSQIDVERIKAVNDNKPKKYTSIKNNEVNTYTSIATLPITREQLWFCFNNEVPDNEGRMWNIERGKSYKAYSEEDMSKALELLKTHTYDEVAEMTGITKSTLVRNNPNKRKLNRN